ncbi:hypothetical protein PRZ48_008787 [Zasmidium cellare]|uniref:Uncharacterized protein n=1 Tax=Zasmidium cellare TaxID=395010 RepID=A0ABR0EHC1_ZASCE|nr:hypothetical protein PRZ48_008787 [Zasmidium cellare]
MSQQLPKQLQGARADELVMLRIIGDMAKASAQGVFGCETEENINKRLKGCEARFFEPEVQTVLEGELRDGIHSYFLYLKTKELFNLRARTPAQEKKEDAEDEAQTRGYWSTLGHADMMEPALVNATKNTTLTSTSLTPLVSIPIITLTPPATDDEQEKEKFSNAQHELDATDFSDPSNALTSVPKKGDKNRKKLWQNMEMNSNVLDEVITPGKDARLFTSRASVSPSTFSVSIKESSIRPVITFQFIHEESIKDARALANSIIASQYLTQPPMPVMVTLRFPKASSHPDWKSKQQASVNAELAPTTIGQIAKAAILLHATQAQNWENQEESWKWDAMAVSKKGAKGEVKEIQGLMRSNPVFVRVAKPATSSMASTSPATAQKIASNYSNSEEVEQDAGKESNNSVEQDRKESETYIAAESDEMLRAEQGWLKGMSGWVGGLLIKFNPVFMRMPTTISSIITTPTTNDNQDKKEGEGKVEDASKKDDTKKEDGETVKSSGHEYAHEDHKEGGGGVAGWLKQKVFGW